MTAQSNLPRSQHPPLVVGGTGGSGTRVVSRLLSEAGVMMGFDCNHERDTLTFTYFFKHPHWFASTFGTNQASYPHLHALHEKISFGRLPTTPREIRLYLWAGLDHMIRRYWYKYNLLWVLNRVRKLVFTKPISYDTRWGWKESHATFHLSDIASYYRAPRYIHIIRNGLDMAYSRTHQELADWGHYFDLDRRDTSPRNIFECWYRFNKYAIETGTRLFGSRFLLVRFEELCTDKERAVKELLAFSGIGPEKATPEIIGIPRLPPSVGRYRENDQSWIDKEVLRKLGELGCSRSEEP